MTAYRVDVKRSDRCWLLHIPSVNRYAEARRLREVAGVVRGVIAEVTGDDPGAVELDVHIEKPEPVQAHLRRVAELRQEEARAKRAAAEELRAAARSLRAEGMPLRDVGEVLGVSYQRAHQLVST